jgi:hypothetical protein
LLYDPSSGFSTLANELAAWEEGNGTARLWADYGMAPISWSPLDLDKSLIMITAIDAAGRSPADDLTGFHLLFDPVNQSSVYVGEGYAMSIPLITTGLKIVPPESQLFSGKSSEPPNIPPSIFLFCRPKSCD